MHGYGPPGPGGPGYGHGPPGPGGPGYGHGYGHGPPGPGGYGAPPGPGRRPPPRGGGGGPILIGVAAVGALFLVGGVMFLVGRSSSSAPVPTVVASAAPSVASVAPLASLVPADPTTAAPTETPALAPLATAKPAPATAQAAGKIRGKRYNFACPKGTEPNGAVRSGCLCDSEIHNPCAGGFSDIEETAWGCWFTCE